VTHQFSTSAEFFGSPGRVRGGKFNWRLTKNLQWEVCLPSAVFFVASASPNG